MKKTILVIMSILAVTTLVLAMNLRISSWSPRYDNTRNYTLVLNQGDVLDKICSLGIFSDSCYMSEWDSSDLVDYNLHIYCEGDGCQFFTGLPIDTSLPIGTKYKYTYAVNIPMNATPKTYDFNICGLINETECSGNICYNVEACNSDKFTINNTCIEKWKCSAWSKCRRSIQTRTCNDLNTCGTNLNKPVTTQTCNKR